MPLLKAGNKEFVDGRYAEALEYYQRFLKRRDNHDKYSLNSTAIFNIKLALNRIYSSNRSTYDIQPVSETDIDRAFSVLHEKDDIVAMRKSGFFDQDYYLSANPDVAGAGVDPALHFHMHGWKEDRNPSKTFDVSFYKAEYKDNLRQGENPLVYHIRTGAFLGCRTSRTSRRRAVTPETISPIFKERRVGPCLFDKVASRGRLYGLLKNHDLKEILPAETLDLARTIVKNVPLSVSVIVPMWNRATTIVRAIDSILSQTYSAEQIIVIDDGSDDGSYDLVETKYQDYLKNERIVLLKTEHQGVSSARNAGLKVARSDLITYLDSDNEWDENYLLIMAAVFGENPAIGTAYAGLKHIDNDNGTVRHLGRPYDRRALVQSNYIDMNVFAHRRFVSDQVGGFDEQLKRLVDWDFILRCTKFYSSIYIPFCAVDYYLDKDGLNNISRTVPLDENRVRVQRKHTTERLKYGLDSIKLAYVLWDWPALSQTFVIEEIRWLVQNGQDVIVYYKTEPDRSAVLDFDVDCRRVEGHIQLAKLLLDDDRNIIHSHFAYPAVTLLTYPAAKATGIPFSFYAHAVDIFHENNKKRNRVGEIVNDDLCLRVFVHGDYHKQVLEESGVHPHKIFYAMQAVDIERFKRPSSIIDRCEGTKKIVFVGRFVEKKGVDILLKAAESLSSENVVFELYGYGPLYDDMARYAKDKTIANVHFKGVLQGSDELNKVFDQCDALVVPSVVAENGDTEGFPTIIFEAMAAGIPVIASAVSSVPSYLKDGVEAMLVEPGNPFSLSEKIKEFIRMPITRLSAMISNAKTFLVKNVGIEKLFQSYVDCWFDFSIDIFLVTFNNEKYEDSKETFEIIRRILAHTNTPFSLTIVDNNSDSSFRDSLVKMSQGDSRIKLILNTDNGYCGPASNTALWSSQSRFSVYVCSKEGFVGKHGWDRIVLGEFRYDEHAALGGHLVHLPKYTLGKELENFPDFEKFRNKKFARNHRERVFMHIQGGVFIINRDCLVELEGFNPKIPQAGMDVELSYYAESKGYLLKSIPPIKSITTKTLPRIHSSLDEDVVIAHPFTYGEATSNLDFVHSRKVSVCNICGTKAPVLVEHGAYNCCQSTPFGRSVFKEIAYYPNGFRSERALLLTDDVGLIKRLSDRMYNVVVPPAVGNDKDGPLAGLFSVIVLDFDFFYQQYPSFERDVYKALHFFQKKLAAGGVAVFAFSGFENPDVYSTVVDALPGKLKMVDAGKSNVIGEDWRPLFLLTH